MTIYEALDEADVFVEKIQLKVVDWLFSQFSKIGWYWNEFTILCILLFVICLLQGCFIALHLQNNKRIMSRAFWRGWKESEKNTKQKGGKIGEKI